MRANYSLWTRSLWSAVVAIAAIGLTASNAAAQANTQVHLIAAPVTKNVTLPNGTVVSVPMWGYALDANNNGLLDGTEQVTVPGPRIVVPEPTGPDDSLAVTLTNLLPEATSLVIPGQRQSNPGVPVRTLDGRLRSQGTEVPAGGTWTYTFNNVKPGTYLYQSGSHPAVQVQMGLYGALTQESNLVATDPNPHKAYPGVGFDTDVVLLFSEIDLALHEAVANGTYATTGPTSTVDYRPSIFLINGESYTDATPAILAGTTNSPGATSVILLRMLNAGLRTHAPVLDRGSLEIVAEDGNKLPFAADRATVLLAAGKTHDARWRPGGPANAGVYSLYDRALGLNARGSGAGQGSAGMLVKLRVDLALATQGGRVVAYNDGPYSVTEGGALAAGASVLANDTWRDTVANGSTILSLLPAPNSGTSTATLATNAQAGTVSLASNGTFTYTPAANFAGIDSFTYQAHWTSANGNTTLNSEPATVVITVAGVNDAPVANAQAVGVDQNGNVSVTLTATDADGDALKYYVASPLPSHGALSYIDPLTKVQTPIVAADLFAQATKKAIPGGLVIYTPTAGYVGSDAFNFVAFDGSLSGAAQVSATVSAVDNPATAGLTQPVTLTVKGADGTLISAYRWTLEEDLTYKPMPGVADPYTLAVSFHKSYMPVVAAGTQGDPVQVDPTKRYFVSVLPTENPNSAVPAKNYSNGGTEIEVGQTEATITVANLPLPTARIRVRVFQDNAPLNGMWDSTESGLAGFQVTIDDAGGTYGMSGGHQSTDAFGNKIGTTYAPCDPGPCDSYQVSQLGNGFVLTDADGYAVIENLVMGKYTVKVRAPGADRWIQTTTIEGQPGIDAWVKPNEPQFFTEFGPPGPHVFVGFTRAVDGTGPLAALAGPYTTIKGRVTNLRQSRPIAVAQFSGAPFTHTRAWVALNSGATGGSLLYAQPTNPDGTFSIAHVPAGSYQLIVFDSALDIIIGSAVVNVAGPTVPATTDVHDVAVFPWFTTLYSYVYEDTDRDGHHDANEPGMSDQALNIRFRDGSIYQSLSTAENGFKAFNEVFPFFAWMVAEVDYTRFHSTGLTVVVDAGGDASAAGSNAYNWQAQAGLPAGLIPPEVLNPQPQPDNGNAPFRNESGAETPFLLLEGFQSFIGQSTVMLWGKAPYEKAGSFTEDVNVAPFDDFPGPGDVDANGDGFFNTDRSNGGIAGIVHYGITRAENDPRWAAAENWEPGVSDVRVQLWDENRTHLLNEVTTDNWNNSVPEGCQWPGTPFTYLNRPTDCFDGLRVFNQARPALFDGGYAFSTILQDSASSPTYALPIAARGVARPIPAGNYVVKIIVPPGYKLQKEEDKNVDFGDSYVPQQFWLTGYPLADGGPADAQPAPTVQDNALIAPFCVGQLHLVPDTLALFPGQVGGTFAGEMRPLCDAKLVTLREGQQAAPDFHLFTDAPVAGHIYGMVLDDTTNEFDPNAPTFGEKYGVPFVGVAIRDWQGREVTRTMTDQYGMYNALVPSSYTANPPEPSGVSPQILMACINPPTMPGPGGTVVADPNFQKQYSHFCYPLQYLAGKTTYLDTPVVPTGAFTGNGTLPVDAEFPNGTPVIASVTGPEASAPGPYIVDRGAADNASRTIVITSAGQTQVANPAWDGSISIPKLIPRDYGFGPSGTVILTTTGNTGTPIDTLLSVTNWAADGSSITAIVPTGLRTGQLTVVRGSGATARKSTLGITLSVATPDMHTARPPKVVDSGQSIQAAVDAATPGDLILVKPGVHEEMVVMSKPVRLQGFGALSSAINVVTTPAENIQAWLDKVGNLLLSGAYSLPNQPAMTPPPFFSGDVAAVVGDEGPGVLVLSKNQPTVAATRQCVGTFAVPGNEAYCLQNENYTVGASSTPVWRPNARIDGFSLIGASNAPGVLVNGYAHWLEISNNKIFTNSGTYAGGIHVGHVGAAAPFNDENAQNDNVAIHNNMVTQNAGIETAGGGGIVLGTGSTGYKVKDNFVAANFAAGNGGGIAHIGLSNGGVIDRNTVVFNESFAQGVGTNGGGLFVGGTPAAAGATTPGSGSVDVTNNLVQGNAASGGDGGGIALLGFTTADRVRLFNNIIANNVAGLAGGGISIEGVPTGGSASTFYVDIAHDTIVDNDSTGTAGAAFDRGPLTSSPQPGGISGRGTSMAHVRIANSIVWHNRTFWFGPCDSSTVKCGIVPVGSTDPTQFAEIQNTARPYWDLANLTGSQFTPVSSVLTALTGPNRSADYLNNSNYVTYASSNSSAAPAFVAWYFNTSRQAAYQVGETTGEATLISTPAALDEGGNFIRPQFGPLSLENPNSTPPNQPFGNYHVSAGVGGANLATLYGSVPPALTTDFDGDVRPTVAPHRGADQAGATALPPTLTSISPTSGAQGATVSVTLFGTNLTGATAVTVSGTGVTVGALTVNGPGTQVTTTFTIASGATTGARTVSITTPSGTSGTVNFTVAAPAPGTVTVTSEAGPASLLLGNTILAFGNVGAGTYTDTVTLTVGGGTAVTFGTATVTDGAGPGTHSKGTDTCSGNTVPVGGTCTIQVILVMPGGGITLSVGSLSVPSNGTPNPRVLGLTGS
jgi:large repetitive protein